MSTSTTIKEVMRELTALEDPKMRGENERRGDDHGVNLTHLRALAKRLKTQLWGKRALVAPPMWPRPRRG